MFKLADFKKQTPKRDPLSYKSKNGRVLVVGGSIDYHGAPLFSAWGALNAGADLVYMAVPECNFEVSRNFAPDLIVRKYPGEFLNTRAQELILAMAQKADVAVFGPGLGDRTETMRALKFLVEHLPIPTILDTTAIQVLEMIEKMPLKQKLIITPHHSEFEKLTGKSFKISDPSDHKVRVIRTLAKDLGINILLKGPVDIIAGDEGQIEENSTGNAGMTVGGSGDVLSGLVAGLLAQGVAPFDACACGAYILGTCGDRLFKVKGYAYTASDLANEIPFVVKEILK
jgi:NAD(P)H-hydrate epimerase